MTLKILIVDDSALMRKYLTQILGEGLKDAELNTAHDGVDALEKIRSWDPDVVTLDINMPVMDGLTCLAHIMEEVPRPVVMVSSLTERDALATFEALNLGAVDYIPKPGGTVSLNIRQVSDVLIQKVSAAGRLAKIQRVRSRARRIRESLPKALRPAVSAPAAARPPRSSLKPSSKLQLVLVGVSTGGPSTLEGILSEMPATFPIPILVAQHMPATFTRVFAKRLSGMCALRVEEVSRRTKLDPGTVYIAQGNADVLVSRLGLGAVAAPTEQDPEHLWHPSVERMVRSALDCMNPSSLIGVMLTGMGYDGAPAMAELHERGGFTIAESEETAVIYGMPRELVARQGADKILPNHRVAGQLLEWAQPPA